MSYLIAVTGKGGVGKTTLSALMIRRLTELGKTPVLAVDADPNSCLDAAMGVVVTGTVGRAREEVRDEAASFASDGISKQEALEMKIAESLVESKGFDLIAMGRPEGSGCYCYANNVLKSIISQIAKEYPYVLLDNEAGLENLSRRIVKDVDLLILVSDASNTGLDTLVRLYDLAVEMEIGFNKLFIVINKLRGEKPPKKIIDIQTHTKAEKIFYMNNNEELAILTEDGKPLTELPENNDIIKVVDDIISCL